MASKLPAMRHLLETQLGGEYLTGEPNLTQWGFHQWDFPWVRTRVEAKRNHRGWITGIRAGVRLKRMAQIPDYLFQRLIVRTGEIRWDFMLHVKNLQWAVEYYDVDDNDYKTDLTITDPIFVGMVKDILTFLPRDRWTADERDLPFPILDYLKEKILHPLDLVC